MGRPHTLINLRVASVYDATSYPTGVSGYHIHADTTKCWQPLVFIHTPSCTLAYNRRSTTNSRVGLNGNHQFGWLPLCTNIWSFGTTHKKVAQQLMHTHNCSLSISHHISIETHHSLFSSSEPHACPFVWEGPHMFQFLLKIEK